MKWKMFVFRKRKIFFGTGKPVKDYNIDCENVDNYNFDANDYSNVKNADNNHVDNYSPNNDNYDTKLSDKIL
jgi:hypothetical protein